MENINWALSIQAGILLSLVYLIFQVKEVVATLDVHFNQHHIRQNDTAQILAEQPTYSQLYSLSKGEYYYSKK